MTTGLGYPKKARDARANPKVALLFSDATGSGIEDAPQVLVQGIAEVDDRDLEANRSATRARRREAPGTKEMLPPKPLQRLFSFYFTRLYIHVRPERVYVWPGGDPRASRSCSTRTWRRCARPRRGAARAARRHRGRPPVWDERMDELGGRYPNGGALARGAGRLPVFRAGPDLGGPAARRIRLGADVLGVPVQPGSRA